jgi:hypothetical protein
MSRPFGNATSGSVTYEVTRRLGGDWHSSNELAAPIPDDELKLSLDALMEEARHG